MDITPYISELKPAPRAVFDRLATHRAQARFMIPRQTATGARSPGAASRRMIREIALWLSRAGIAPGDRGAVFAPNRVEWGAAALAIQAAGAVMVPVYGASTASRRPT
jgi:long-subunit acyl-CoA synthetase (AMP-forming)